jgi:hypothetical protein
MTSNLFVVKSPLGHDVCCSENNWHNHIARNHAIMCNNLEAVKNTIVDPDAIYQSEEWPNRNVYFGKSNIATYKDSFYTKVIVASPNEYNGMGSIVSAWPQKDISGNIDEEGLKYVRSKLR